MNEKLIEIGEFIHKSLLNGSSKTNPAFDEVMLLYVCNSLTILKEQEKRINELEEKLRLLEYGDLDTLQSAMMPAT